MTGVGLESELEIAKAQLIEVHQMALIGRLMAHILHEINTPIGSIFSNNEVLLQSIKKLKELLSDAQPAALAQAKSVLETCHALASVDQIACDQISSVIRGLKTFARVDVFGLRHVDLNDNLRNTLKLTRAEFRHRIEVETDFGELPEVECYPHMLNQVFLNLLINAGQAIEGEGKITIRTREDGGYWHVSISDTGYGMTPEQQKKIFVSGFTTKPAGEGMGMGLAICRQIVEERHGGMIDFESAPGAGTTFHVRIPIRQSRGFYE
jgi:signal transduction histidine kinase